MSSIRPKTPSVTVALPPGANSKPVALGESTGFAGRTASAPHVPEHDFRWLDEAERRAAAGETPRASRSDSRWSE